ncbi:MAG: SulP family inorganic anion transporter [bacterium]|nr:SulP family inorganic anion transporter [bacterium]
MPRRIKIRRIPRPIRRALPFLNWFEEYSLHQLKADFVAGLTVALVLIPQSMAYAQLAGLPVYYGLYAAFLPPIVGAMFGSSHQLATGPVAVVSLMTCAALQPLAAAGSPEFVGYAILLAFLVGVFQLALGFLRLGLIINLLSHPVVNGFTNAAALIIATSQLSKIFGVYVDSDGYQYQMLMEIARSAVAYTHWPTFALAALAFLLMIGLKRYLPRVPNVLVAVTVTTLISYYAGFERHVTVPVARIEAPAVREDVARYNETLGQIERAAADQFALSEQIRKAEREKGGRSAEAMRPKAELAIAKLHAAELNRKLRDLRRILRACLLQRVQTPGGVDRFVVWGSSDDPAEEGVWRIKVGTGRLDAGAIALNGGGDVVGRVPAGLPRLAVPRIESSIVLQLALAAVVISLLGFMEAISIAKAMAARTRQHIDPDRELMGQGLANLVGSFAQSYPTSGSFSRSAVNLQAGGATGLSNVFSSCVVVLILLFFTPLLYYLPQSVLAAIIMMAVLGLVNVRGFVHHWRTQRSCGLIAVVSFVATLTFAPYLEWGILIGVLLTISFFLLGNMKPEIALLSKHPDGAFRSAERHGLQLCRRIAVIRFNGSLFFANVNYLEEAILERVATMPHVRHILIVGNGINMIDASGEDMLSLLVARLREAGYGISFSGLNDSVMDVLKRTGLYERIGADHFFRDVAAAVRAVHETTHEGSLEIQCPLIDPVFSIPKPPKLDGPDLA